MSPHPFPQDRLVAIYPSRAEADAAARSLLDLGVDRELVRIGDGDDQRAALVGEMRQETSGSFKLFNSALVTGEQAKGSALGIPAGAAVGVVVGLVVGALAVGAGSLVPRLLLGALLGALFGGVVGMVVGGGLGTRGPAAPGAAQGVPVSVGRTDDLVRRALDGNHVMRIDVVLAGGNPVETLTVDDQGQPDEVAILRDHLTQPTGGDWSTVAPDEPRLDESTPPSDDRDADPAPGAQPGREAARPASDDPGHDQVAGAPSDNTTLVAILADLRGSGYAGDLRAVGDTGDVRCGSCGQEVVANELGDVVERRLEGASDPDDMVLAVGARCPRCGGRGVLTLGYGPAASASDAAVVALLP